MKNYKYYIYFFLFIALFTLIVAGFRLHWIHKALPSKAKVLYIGQTRFIRPTQYYPVVSYETLDGEVVTRGTYNLPISIGETVSIVYNPDNIQEFRLNTSYWLWYDIWSWYRMIWIAISMYFLVLYLVKLSSNRKTQPLFKNESRNGSMIRNDVSETDTVSINTIAFNPDRTSRKTKRFAILAKAILLFLIPISLFFIGDIWGVPYAKQISAIILLSLIALGSPSNSTTDSDL
jgi:hypothetical protein